MVTDPYTGDSVIEGYFSSVERAWEHSANMGSRWYFFPAHFVVTSSHTKIVECCEEFSDFGLEGKSFGEFKKWMAENGPSIWNEVIN